MGVNSKAMKQLVVDKAREQVGHHYLWSTAGNTPGQKDGASFRPDKARLHPNVPDLQQNGQTTFHTPPYSPMVFAAWADTNDGKLVCSGRAGNEAIWDKKLALDLPVKDALKLTLKTITEEQIAELQANSKNPDQFRWPRQNSYLDHAPQQPHATVWGESCLGKRHFDCIGLVNYCLTTVLNRPWQFGISNFTNPATARSVGFTEVNIHKAEPCDIVTIGSEHIGIVSFNGTAVEAMDVAHGVVERPLDFKYWQKCFRLPDSTWR